MRVDEHTIELASVPTFYRAGATASAGPTPVYLHGLPTSSEDWQAALERTGGIAPDLIGFGRSGKGGHLEYTLAGLARAVADLLDALEFERVRLAGHGWGAAVALHLAAAEPERVDGVALVSPLPLVSGHLWSGAAALWRRPVLGELAMGSITRGILTRRLRSAGFPTERIAGVWTAFDQGTQRAILRLHRSTGASTLEDLRPLLAALAGPALVQYGARDPWLTAEQAGAVAALLPRAELDAVAEAGHWPWLEQSGGLDRLCAFMTAEPLRP